MCSQNISNDNEQVNKYQPFSKDELAVQPKKYMGWFDPIFYRYDRSDPNRKLKMELKHVEFSDDYREDRYQNIRDWVLLIGFLGVLLAIQCILISKGIFL